MSAGIWKIIFIISVLWVVANIIFGRLNVVDPEIACKEAIFKIEVLQMSADGKWYTINDQQKCQIGKKGAVKHNDENISSMWDRAITWTATTLGILAAIDQGIRVIRGKT
jgi:hypothetical protein